MCFSNTLYKDPKAIKKLKPIFKEPIYFANGFDHPKWPILTAEGPSIAQWGLVPHWCKNEIQANELQTKTLNAKSETLFEKSSFVQAAESHHCLIYSTGFFEYQDRSGDKIPYFIQHQKEEIFTMAGVFDIWRNPNDNQVLKSFSIITTGANEMMSEIHNVKKRMPVILDEQQGQLWLNFGFNMTDAESLLQPCPNDWLKAHTVHKKNMKKNKPESIRTYHYPIQGSLF